MIITSKDDILKTINSDWSNALDDQSGVASVCLKIVQYLINRDLSQINYLNYGDLIRIIGQDIHREALLQAIQYLTGDRLHLLDIKFELITDNDESIDISKSYLNQARSVGTLVHPETGETICNFEEKVFIYFHPSSLAKQYLK